MQASKKHRSPRWLIGIGISGVLLITAAPVFLHVIDTGLVASKEHKSAKVATATVVRVTEQPEKEEKGVRVGMEQFQVCFVIDDFSQVAADERDRYKSAEAQRVSRAEPRCEATTDASLAKRLKVGEKVAGTDFLGNENQIDIVRISAFGRDL